MIGQVLLGKYRVTRPLDEGGLSRIYLARALDVPREVVIKVLKEEYLSHPRVCELFRREIHIMQRFQHPNAVTFHDAAPADPGGPVLVMEYLRGRDLSLLLQMEGRLAPDRVGRILAQLCDVLQAAHDAGIVHRDVKPGNIFVVYPGTPQETVKLMDFGLAHMSSLLYISPEELLHTEGPAGAGTPEYVSPEQIRGSIVDGRSDLYSVGVILFEMLTGRRPFERGSVEALLVAHLDDEPPSFAQMGLTGIPPGIEQLVRACLAKSPDDRPSSPAELVRMYEKALGRKLLLPGRRGTLPPSKPPSRTQLQRPALPARSGRGPSTPVPTLADRQAIRHSLEASMPEAIAMVKLKGFIFDLGGKVVESVPGLIRVALPALQAAERKGGLLSWVKGTSTTVTTAPPTELELHMERRDPSAPSKLTVTLVLRPQGTVTNEWRDHCNKIGRDLQAYLMR